LPGHAILDHVPNDPDLLLVVAVVEHQSTVIRESAPFAVEAFLVLIEPQAKFPSSLGGPGLFASLALQSPVNLCPDHSADLKSFLRLLGLAVFAPQS
jgi:hypothetical protein